MRVLHVIARMNVGGTATYLYTLLKGLESRGLDVLLALGIVPKNENEDSRVEELQISRIRELSRSLSPLRDYRAWKNLKLVIDEFQPDIIQSHTFKAGLLTSLVKRSVPWIHTFHGHHLYDPEFGWISQKILTLINKRIANEADKIITSGKQVANELLAVGIGKEGQYVSIAPGVEINSEFDAKKIREKLMLRPSDFVVVWMGRFTRVKRPELMVQIANKLPSVTFLMAGNGELFEEIENLAPPNLRLLGNQKASHMWLISDLALLTSESEGMPLALIEAQLFGVPVVATDVGSVSEIVEDGVTGVLVGVDSNEIAASITALLENPDQIAAMSKAAQKRAQKMFTSQIMVDKYLEVYDVVTDRIDR